jgi:hypothetical protein
LSRAKKETPADFLGACKGLDSKRAYAEIKRERQR